MAYIWDIVNATLNETEKNRFMCCVINTDQSTFMSNVDWKKATQDYGAASVESMKKGITNSLKKVEKAGGKDGVPAVDGAASTPSTMGKGGKRKIKAENDGDEHDAGDVGTPTPKPKRGRKKKEPAAARKGESRFWATRMFVDRSFGTDTSRPDSPADIGDDVEELLGGDSSPIKSETF
jgi:hypothetical protein